MPARRRLVDRRIFAIAAMMASAAGGCADRPDAAGSPEGPRAGRREVVLWHFWGGEDRPVVERIIGRFNASQQEHWARAIAMPGNNLDVKFFLSYAGGDPPDVLNQDDPIVADWAHRGAILPLGEFAPAEDVGQLSEWLLPAARKIGSYQGRLYALCNGLDIRALYLNQTMLTEHGLSLPVMLDDLDRIAETIAPPAAATPRQRMGFLPNPSRIWAWGIVFGGRFYDPGAAQPAERITADSPAVVRALEWMAGYRDRYGGSQLAAFRDGEQALAGTTFPLLANRRYAAMMDGQWRVRDIARAKAHADLAESSDEFVVLPLPPPRGGKHEAGWVNGNFFVVPRGAGNPQGAWELMKFWSGFGNLEHEAAAACAAGGWIPPAAAVIEHPHFQAYLDDQPLMRQFVKLAASPHQQPTPSIPVSSLYYEEVVSAAQDVLYRGADARQRLSQAADRVRHRLSEVLDERP